MQEVLNKYIEEVNKEKTAAGKTALYLGQHLNGEEAMVKGASLVATNSSRGIRP